MLTIFSIPKPFIGHIGTIQRNAIRSWSLLRPPCEIMLFADETGTAEVAAEMGATHVPGCARNEYGTPLLDSVFAHVEQTAKHRLLCFVNADVMLMSDFPQAVARVVRSKQIFMMVGQRHGIDVSEPLTFGAGWEERLRRRLATHGRLEPPCGSDYFVWPRATTGGMPPFAVGRPFWDTWFIYRARSLGMPVVDASRVVTAVHQDHDYSHVAGQRGDAWHGPEGDRNLQLSGVTVDRGNLYRIANATHVLTPRWLLPALGYRYLECRHPSLRMLAGARRPLGALRRLVASRAR